MPGLLHEAAATQTEWGAVIAAFSMVYAVLLNTVNKNTFERNDRTSIVDLSFASWTIWWKVSDIYTHNDHTAILMRVDRHCSRSTLDEGVLRYLKAEQDADLLHGNTSDAKASLFSNLLFSVCGASMVKKIQSWPKMEISFLVEPGDCGF